MEAMKQKMKRELSRLERVKVFSPLTVFISEQVLDNEGVLPTGLQNDGKLTTLSIGTSIRFLFCFWEDTNRFTFLIEDREIMDNYLSDQNESLECLSFLKEVFSHEIQIEYYYKGKKNRRYKIIYKYYVTDENGRVTLFSDEALYSV